MPTRNINLTDRCDCFVDEQVRSGRFSNASEVLRAGLHLLEEQCVAEQEKLALLRALVREGFHNIDQGNGIEINGQEALREFIGQIGGSVARTAASRSTGA